MGGWGHDCGDGFGFAWIFPALIFGRVLSEAFDWPKARRWPQTPPSGPAPAPQPHPAQAQAKAHVPCQDCDRPVHADYKFCPHCGVRVGPRTCRYCGQLLKREMAYCPHCGGPAK